MKKVFLAVLAAALVCGFVAAQEEGIGLTAGVGVDFGNVADEAVISVIPQVIYENSFDDLDVYVEADYAIALPKDVDAEMDLYLEEDLGYNLHLGDASTLTLGLYNWNDFTVTPSPVDPQTGIWGEIDPSVKFTYDLGNGSVYGKLGVPLTYAQGYKDADLQTAAYLKAGYDFPFGLGFWFQGKKYLSPDSNTVEIECLVSYDMEDTFHAELDFYIDNATVDNEFKAIAITPEFEYYFSSFTFAAEVEFGNIGGDGDVSVTPTIWVKYSF